MRILCLFSDMYSSIYKPVSHPFSRTLAGGVASGLIGEKCQVSSNPEEFDHSSFMRIPVMECQT